jgi:hypothetical protein
VEWRLAERERVKGYLRVQILPWVGFLQQSYSIHNLHCQSMISFFDDFSLKRFFL